MKVERLRQGSITVATPHDALTEASLPAVRGALEPEAGQIRARLVLDMADVPFVDSAGIEFLLELAGETAAGATRPRIVGLTDTVREALYLTDTLERFFVFDSIEAALRSYI